MSLTFIDLFAGIGGTRIAFEEAGCQCVFSSEWDRFAQKTYAANFGETPQGDIREVASCDIPNHDILVAGFPCQPFSISGVSKKNSLNRPHGFDDPTQGTLFFEIKRILAEKRPRAFLLENVKNLKSHDHGRTFQVVLSTLRDELGYDVRAQVLNSTPYVPQHRPRIYIVGFDRPTEFSFPTRQSSENTPKVSDILEEHVDRKYTLSWHLWDYLQDYARRHKEQGHGFGYGLVHPWTSHTRTLSARYHKDGSEILVWQGEEQAPRRLTPRECAGLMGFTIFRPEFDLSVVSDTQAYRQFGNSVVVPLVKEIADEIVRVLECRNEHDSIDYFDGNQDDERCLSTPLPAPVGPGQLPLFPMAK